MAFSDLNFAESIILRAWLCLEASRLAAFEFPSVSAASESRSEKDAIKATASINNVSAVLPLTINTWGFVNATESARLSWMRGGDAVDAVIAAGTSCEVRVHVEIKMLKETILGRSE